MKLSTMMATVLAPTDVLAAKAAAWQSAQTDLIHAGGIVQASWVYTASQNSGENTFIYPGYAFCQDCQIKQITVQIVASTGAAWAFRVFRYNAGTSQYDYIDGQTFTPPSGGAAVRTFTFTTPIAVQMGDIPGFYVPDSSNKIGKDNTAPYTNSRYAAGNITSSNAFTSNFAYASAFEAFTTPPYLVVTGDSIAEGHNNGGPNSANSWHGNVHTTTAAVLKTLPGGVPEAEIANQVRGMCGVLQYQNKALGSQTFNWVAGTGIGLAVALKSKLIICHCGVNDVATARSWANVETNLNTIKAALTAGQVLLLDEILPWPAATDDEAATIRTFNGNLATWCAANGATLVLCHDALAQVRVSTGYLDDGLTGMFFSDNVHLTYAGVNALAAIWKRYLGAA